MKTYEAKTYELRNVGYCSYALITLTDLQSNAGTISIVSDYGSWSYLWGSMGGTIKDFLIRTNTGYLMDKFTYDKREDAEWFDARETLKRIKKYIIEDRKDDIISRELARKAWDEAVSIHESSDFNTANEYVHVVDQEGEALWEVFDFESMPCVRTYAPGIRSFMEEVWPVFIKELN